MSTDASGAEIALVPGVVGVHHIGIAVRDLDAALKRWVGLLGAHIELRAVVEDQGVEAVCLEWAGAPGGAMIELVAPHGVDSRFAAALNKRGEGMHHIAWEVEDVAVALASLAHAGARVIDAEPRMGLHGTPVAFVHPSTGGGVLIELVQSPRS